jgi:hypothetical protein
LKTKFKHVIINKKGRVREKERQRDRETALLSYYANESFVVIFYLQLMKRRRGEHEYLLFEIILQWAPING